MQNYLTRDRSTVRGADHDKVTVLSVCSLAISGSTGAEKGPVFLRADTESESLLSLKFACTEKV